MCRQACNTTLEAPAQTHAHQNGVHLEGAQLGTACDHVGLDVDLLHVEIQVQVFGQRNVHTGLQGGAKAVAVNVPTSGQLEAGAARVVQARTHVGLKAGYVKVVLKSERGRQVLERANGSAARTQGVQ